MSTAMKTTKASSAPRLALKAVTNSRAGEGGAAASAAVLMRPSEGAG